MDCGLGLQLVLGTTLFRAHFLSASSISLFYLVFLLFPCANVCVHEFHISYSHTE